MDSGSETSVGRDFPLGHADRRCLLNSIEKLTMMAIAFPLLQTCLCLFKLDLVDAAANAFQIDFHNIPVFQPDLRLAAHTNTLWTGSM